jgi:hypothetical protein
MSRNFIWENLNAYLQAEVVVNLKQLKSRLAQDLAADPTAPPLVEPGHPLPVPKWRIATLKLIPSVAILSSASFRRSPNLRLRLRLQHRHWRALSQFNLDPRPFGC